MKANLFLILLLVIITVISYANSLPNSFVWDDEQFIVKNKYVETFDVQKIFSSDIVAGSGFTSNYYRPITSLTFALDHAIWGYNPVPFRIVNILLHIGAGVVLFLVLQKLNLDRSVSFWISLFFLIHPVQVEAVTYINSRGDSLYALFLFLFLYCAVQLCIRKQKSRWFIGGTVSFICALLSKEIAIIGIALMALIFWKQNLLKVKRAWIFAGGILGITACYALLRLTVLNFDNSLNFYKQHNVYTDSLLVRLYTFCHALLVYVQLLIFPYPLHMERSLPVEPSMLSPVVLGVLLVVIAILGVSVFLFVKRNDKIPLFGFLWFFIGLAPVSGIVPINGLIYEHWLYVPLIGFFICITGIINNLHFNQTMRKMLVGIVCVVVGIFILLTIRQNTFWKDPINIFTYTLRYEKTTRLYTNLAVELANAGRVFEAIPYYLEATKLDDSFPHTYYNLGNAYLALGEYEQAEKAYLETLRRDPNFQFVYPNLINVYLAQKHYDKAIPYFEKIISTTGGDERTQIVYVVCLIKVGREADAEKVLNDITHASKNPDAISLQVQKLLAE